MKEVSQTAQQKPMEGIEEKPKGGIIGLGKSSQFA
jgi:hypothetical protein